MAGGRGCLVFAGWLRVERKQAGKERKEQKCIPGYGWRLGRLEGMAGDKIPTTDRYVVL